MKQWYNSQSTTNRCLSYRCIYMVLAFSLSSNKNDPCSYGIRLIHEILLNFSTVFKDMKGTLSLQSSNDKKFPTTIFVYMRSK